MTDPSDRVRGAARDSGRVSVRFPDPMVESLDQLVDCGIFPTRSEAIRASIRGLNRDYTKVDDGQSETVN